ncbi:MAG: response regulator [Legionellaceae bacterium]|nr:response regulator [Legionellaceae bacterium]
MNEQEISILIAEDEEDQRILIQEAILQARIMNTTHFVEDGVELLDFLYARNKYESNKNKKHPHLILLDLNMPKIDGRKALEVIKNDVNLKNIPVVVMTASSAEYDICLSYNLGANSYISKPIDFTGIVEIMKQIGHYWFKVVLLPEK